MLLGEFILPTFIIDADFTLCLLGATSCQTDQGSHAFQIPENAAGSHESWSGFKVDIWAAGVMLLKLFC